MKQEVDKWSTMIDGVDEFWSKFKKGQDFYGPHKGSLLNVAIKKMEILQGYYKTNPEGDDRPHQYLNDRKISLDIDEVLAGWVEAWCEKHNITRPVHYWTFDRFMGQRFEEMKDDKEFWLSIKPLIKPEELPFEPHCYITARSIPKAWTEEWLYDVAGFPHVPVYTVPFGASKVEAAITSGTQLHVDDSYKNFLELTKGGILTYLYDAPHNRKYDVGYKRITHLKELI